MSLSILGTGGALPKRVVTNQDMAKLVDTSDEWIRTRTGIAQRHICGQGENGLSLGIEAAGRALEAAGIRAEDLTMLACHSVAPSCIVPSMACRIMDALGARCPAFDFNVACTGFIYGLYMIKRMADGPALIVCAEETSRYIDFTDRRVCVLFGDGAAAVVVAPGENLAHVEIRAVPDPVPSLYAPGINHKDETGAPLPSYMSMDGPEVFKFATREMMDLLTKAFQATGLTYRDFAAIIPHQANLRIIKSCSERLGIPYEKFLINIDRFGNMSSASIPYALDEAIRAGRLKAGDRLLLAAFGAGWTSGAAVLIL